MKGENVKKTGEMTLEEKVGQLVHAGGAVGGLGDGKGVDYALQLIREKKAGAFYLGYPRYKNPLEAWQVHAKLQAASEIPLFICGDMETSLGYITIDGVQRHPYLMGLGAAGDESLAYEAGAITGREARAVGFNWNYGPCVDVDTVKGNPGVGIRSFGDDPELVSRLGSAYIKGCQSEGTICSAKHFPGHGSIAIDTHHVIGVDATERNSLMEINIPPFRAAISAGVKTAMSTHVIFPAFGDTRFPATLSRSIMTGLLREELGFKGIAVTDSLSMKAIADNYGVREALVRSFLAGCDMIIAPASWQPYDILAEAVRSGEIPEERLNESVEKILALKTWLYPDGYREPEQNSLQRVFESASTGSMLEKLAIKSATVIEKRALPLKAGVKKRLFIIQERDEAYQYCPWEKDVLDYAENMIRRIEPSAEIRRISMSCSEEEARAVMSAAGNHQEIIFFCIVKVLIEQYNGRLSKATARLLSAISRDRTVMGICLGSPYVIEDIENCAGFICTYGESRMLAEIALSILYGRISPSGKLPVSISARYPYGTG